MGPPGPSVRCQQRGKTSTPLLAANYLTDVLSRIHWRDYEEGRRSCPQRLLGLPTLLIWGKQDKVVPVSVAEVYKKSIAGSQLVVFDNCGHRPEVEKQAEFTQQLQRFLA